MATRPAVQALRDERRKNGLCIHCGDPAIRKEGRVLSRCERCTQRSKVNIRLNIERNAVLGMCTRIGCKNEAAPERRQCAKCSNDSNSRSRKTWHKRLAAGLCGDCGEPAAPGLARCAVCNNKANDVIRAVTSRRIAEGKCGRCGKHPLVPGNERCQLCLDKSITRQAALKRLVLDAYGGPVCVGCGENCFEILQIDHIGGGGHKHALKLGNGNCNRGRAKMYRWLRDNGFPSGYRVLCPSCNIKAARGIALPRFNPTS